MARPIRFNRSAFKVISILHSYLNQRVRLLGLENHVTVRKPNGLWLLVEVGHNLPGVMAVISIRALGRAEIHFSHSGEVTRYKGYEELAKAEDEISDYIDACFEGTREYANAIQANGVVAHID